MNPTPDLAHPEPEARADSRGRWFAIVLVPALLVALTLDTYWRGGGSGRGTGNLFQLLIPLLGLGFVGGALLSQFRPARRRVWERNPWRTHLALAAVGVAFVGTLPLGSLVRERSVAASRERCLVVARAAQEHRSALQRWPASLKELEAFAGRRLPRPTFGGDWEFAQEDGSLILEFDDFEFIHSAAWRYDVASGLWRHSGS